jgi:hypothetical protein
MSSIPSPVEFSWRTARCSANSVDYCISRMPSVNVSLNKFKCVPHNREWDCWKQHLLSFASFTARRKLEASANCLLRHMNFNWNLHKEDSVMFDVIDKELPRRERFSDEGDNEKQFFFPKCTWFITRHNFEQLFVQNMTFPVSILKNIWSSSMQSWMELYAIVISYVIRKANSIKAVFKYSIIHSCHI